MGGAFRELPGGAPGGDYLSRAIVDCRGAPSADTAFMGPTSCRLITITGMIAHQGHGTQSASNWAAVWLSNGRPTGTPSSGMGPIELGLAVLVRLDTRAPCDARTVSS